MTKESFKSFRAIGDKSKFVFSPATKPEIILPVMALKSSPNADDQMHRLYFYFLVKDQELARNPVKLV